MLGCDAWRRPRWWDDGDGKWCGRRVDEGKVSQQMVVGARALYFSPKQKFRTVRHCLSSTGLRVNEVAEDRAIVTRQKEGSAKVVGFKVLVDLEASPS